MSTATIQQTAMLLRAPFELDAAAETITEEQLLAVLAARIGEMLERQPGYLFSLLYRLDVLEEKIRPVLEPGAPEPVNWALARLVIERQKQRLETKRSVKPERLGDEWEW